MIRTFKFVILAFFGLVVIACAATPNRESTGEYLDSAALTALVKASLVEKLGTQGFAITVKTYKDEVQLSGFVDSTALKRQAGDIVMHSARVKNIRNNLIVKSAHR